MVINNFKVSFLHWMGLAGVISIGAFVWSGREMFC